MFVLDVDGVLTDGKFTYDASGKIHKVFGAEDADALKLVARFLPIVFVSADHRGLEISRARVHRDMGYPLYAVESCERLDWIAARSNLEDTVYMGDSFLDAPIMRKVGLAIAPDNATRPAKAAADYVTSVPGGSGAVAEACVYLDYVFSWKIPEFESWRTGGSPP